MGSRGGGLAIYIRNNLIFENLDVADCRETEMLCIKIKCIVSEFCLMLVYNPPSVASSIVDNFEALFSKSDVFLKKPTVVVGDFNIDWSTHSTIKNNFDTLMSLHHYNQLVTEYTRCYKDSKTIIDLLFTNSPTLISDQSVVQCDISDHFAVACNIQIKRPKTTLSYVRKRDFREVDAGKFSEQASYMDFHKIEDLSCPHNAANILEEKVTTIVEQSASFKSQKLKYQRSLCLSKKQKNLIKNNCSYWFR